jgi:hypothetical protein
MVAIRVSTVLDHCLTRLQAGHDGLLPASTWNVWNLCGARKVNRAPQADCWNDRNQPVSGKITG